MAYVHSQLSLRKGSTFQEKPCFPKDSRRARPGQPVREKQQPRQGEQQGARALDQGFHLFQDFLLKAVRAKREWSIQVPNA